MPITSVTKDLEALTMTVVADFGVPVERLWDAYADPRQLSKFWGPPEYPMTFNRHDMFAGGTSAYTMSGPEGETAHGYWEFLSVNPGKSFEVVDGFALEDGRPNRDMPTCRTEFDFESTESGSRLVTTSHFASLTEFEKLLEMGMEQGTVAAMGQIDDVVADLASFAAGRATESQILSDTQVRISRIIRGSVEQVWNAHHDAALMQQWLLGPDGWTMPVCEIAANVGDTYRYEWQQVDGDGRFGFTGELLASQAPHRAVNTEAMIGMPGPSTTNELTLTAVEGGTLLTLVVTYPNAEVRDMILATGMTDGMETSYARLESAVLAAA